MPGNGVLVLIAYAQKLLLNAFSVVSSGARGLNFGASISLFPYFGMRRLIADTESFARGCPTLTMIF